MMNIKIEPRGQVAVEMLIIVSFLIMLLLPIIMAVFNVFSTETWKLDVEKTDAVAQTISETADRLVISGEGSISSVSIFIPSRVKKIEVKNNAIIFLIDLPELGTIDVVELLNNDINFQLVGPTKDWEEISGMQNIMLNYSDGVIYLSK